MLLQYVRFVMSNNSWKLMLLIYLHDQYRYSSSGICANVECQSTMKDGVKIRIRSTLLNRNFHSDVNVFVIFYKHFLISLYRSTLFDIILKQTRNKNIFKFYLKDLFSQFVSLNQDMKISISSLVSALDSYPTSMSCLRWQSRAFISSIVLH